MEGEKKEQGGRERKGEVGQETGPWDTGRERGGGKEGGRDRGREREGENEFTEWHRNLQSG